MSFEFCEFNGLLFELFLWVFFLDISIAGCLVLGFTRLVVLNLLVGLLGSSVVLLVIAESFVAFVVAVCCRLFYRVFLCCFWVCFCVVSAMRSCYVSKRFCFASELS